jgi:hypothetical protein|tara:strand:- start:62 stop:397 length:336 start_codon:yes stop_codon:yes gene_type:complete
VTLTNKLERIKIQKLLFYLDKVKKIHEKYMSNGKVFIDTIELRNINEKILVLIKEINLQDNKELKSSSLDLIEHLVEWISIWDKEKNLLIIINKIHTSFFFKKTILKHNLH